MKKFFILILFSFGMLIELDAALSLIDTDDPSVYCQDEIKPQEQPKEDEDEGPWLTGPLLTPSGHTIPKGHFNLEPYLFYINDIGYYNNRWHLQRTRPPARSLNFQGVTQIGLTEHMDMSIIPQFFYNMRGSKHNFEWGDLPIKLGFQLMKEEPCSSRPTMKLEIGETFPIGKFENLDSTFLATDIGGGGAFATSFGLVVSRLFKFCDPHFLSTRMYVGYTVFTSVRVHGLNVFGGDFTTNGVVKPGGSLDVIAGVEYTLTKYWALALDAAIAYTSKTTFKGTTTLPVGTFDHSFLFSLAPAIEYNFNKNVGLILGVWFSVIGENANDFVNGVIALNWYI